MRHRFFLIVALLAFGLSSSATAQERSGDDVISFGSQPGWHLLGGLTGGAAFGSLGAGGYAGLELSISKLQRRVWWGGYVDASYDFAQQGVTLTAGPQLGYGFVGIDGGVAARIDTGDDVGHLDVGPQARVIFTVGLFGIYGRYAYLLDNDAHLGQAGIVLKLPLWAN